MLALRRGGNITYLLLFSSQKGAASYVIVGALRGVCHEDRLPSVIGLAHFPVTFSYFVAYAK